MATIPPTVPIVDYRIYAVLRKVGWLTSDDTIDITARLKAGHTVLWHGLKIKPETETRARIYRA